MKLNLIFAQAANGVIGKDGTVAGLRIARVVGHGRCDAPDETIDCDLICMSSHGRRGISRMILGSETGKVLAHSGVPVLVVK